MSLNEARLQHLPPPTQSKLRSSQILTSLPQIVSELVQNSLDACAARVEIGVDCEEWMCWVQDDGRGMSKSDLRALVTAGRYGTSKAYTPASLDEVRTFGFRGEALASVADLCCLEISSRTQRSRECWSVIVRAGEILYDGPAIRWRRELPGTVVSVRDAFYSLPVRRRSHPSVQRTVELIRKELESLALVFPQVSFSLENTTRSASQSRSDRGRVMAIPKTASTVQAFRHLFGRALVEHIEEIHEVYGEIIVDGFISLEGAPSKTYQYLYVNRHLLVPCDLHRVIDTAFAASSFARHALDEYLELSQPASASRRLPQKAEKKPVYVLNITIPPREVDNCVEPTKTSVHLQNSDAVSNALSSVVQAFLVRHGFRSPPPQRDSQRQSNEPVRKKRKLEPSWSAPNIGASTGSRRGRDAGSSSLRRSHSQTQTPVIVPPDDVDTVLGEEGELLWTDPRSGQTYAVDRRTGNSYPVSQKDDVRGVDGGGGRSSSGRRTLGARPSTGLAAVKEQREESFDMPNWIQEALSANDVYTLEKPKEPHIPALALSSSFASDVNDWQQQHPHRHDHSGHRANKQPGGGDKRVQRGATTLTTPTLLARFSKANLKNARVLGQVDRKFVACVLGNASEGETAEAGSLILIDQHAADERIRVERLLNELCRSSSLAGNQDLDLEKTASKAKERCRFLDPPVRVLLTRHEIEQLAGERGSSMRRAFAAWGVQFTETIASKEQEVLVEDGRQDSGYAQVEVTSVPEVVANKLLEGDQLRDLVKSYLAEMTAAGTAEAAVLGSDVGWQRAIRWCPRELLDLVNSRACRGAIMFNDPLTLERCERLVCELSGAALPFQCAHGRPSLVPLASLGGGGARWSSRQVAGIDWGRFGKDQ